MCDCARANDVTERINYKLHFLNRKLITEGILRYFCHKDTFEDKLNVCRQTGAGKQFHYMSYINICFHCFEKGACAFIVYIGNRGGGGGVPECLLFLDSNKQLNQ